MSGIVGVIANDFARSSLFTSCVWKLDMPDGWRKEMLIGGDWCEARNQLFQMALDEEASHVWFMDDDHAFPPSMLKNLLAHDKPLVMPICLTRVYPFKPVQYTAKVGENQYLPIPLSDSAPTGLVEVEAGGCAGMLVRRDVIEKTQEQWVDHEWAAETSVLKKVPWFEYTDRSEDIIFCEKAKAAGFTLYADLETRLGHISTVVVHPTVREGDWKTGLTIGRDYNLIVDVAENVVSEQPGQPATVETWIWELRRVLDDGVVCRLLLPAGTPFNLAGPATGPTWMSQWYCDDGQGFKEIGDPFAFTAAH